MRRAKISVVGGGNVGASCALWAASKELGDVVVLDIPKAEGVAERLCGTQRWYELNPHIKAFVFEKAKLVGSQHRKAGIAYKIDCCDAHLDDSPGDVPISVEKGEASIAN